MSIRVFITHSHRDAAIAKSITDLLQATLGLEASAIRATSDHFLGLGTGARIDDELRSDVTAAELVIAIISPTALESLYVTIELGARWGTGKPLFPVLIDDVDPGLLQPLSAHKTQWLNETNAVKRLVTDAGEILGIAPETQQLDRLLENWRQVSDSASHQFWRGDTRALDKLVDACLEVRDHRLKHSYQEELLGHLERNEDIPFKFLYLTDECRALWLRNCQDDDYLYYTRSVLTMRQCSEAIAKSIDEILKHEKKRSLDIISLGIGNGHKDRILLESLLSNLSSVHEDGDYIWYYPVDISIGMLTEGIKYIQRYTDVKSLKIKAIIGDFTSLIHPINAVYGYRTQPNLFSILGNTLGSNSEKQILCALKSAIRPDDFVLIEVDAAQGFERHDRVFDLRSERWKKHRPLGTYALQDLGFLATNEFDSSKVTREPVTGKSIVPNVRTMSVGYDGIHLPRQSKRVHVALSSLHLYDPEALFSYFREELSLKDVWTNGNNSISDNEILIYLGQHKP